ncbi:photosystem i reaction center subunit vi chloroplastic [Phtheirospermum japonicum]|uniref:Photosystem I reaction center subunit VI n=1 Tax=Phtheirospermum japonicum TaxID=374723 RepID=A0A830BD22_9LAMI|nr:photosystem i reaction center subunit vi chloroplastic [Phtheirospermum japonicum]
MASLATFAAAQPTAVKGLAGSSIAGTKLHVKPSRLSFKPANSRAGALVVAKYGDKSVYFDLEDIGNTTGQWDLYGSDAPSPYNPLQSKFFETFAAPFTKRGLLLKFLILGGGATLAYVSSQATGDVLPIVKGPQLPPKPGPRGKI